MKTDSIALGVRIGQMVDPAFFCSWTEALIGAVRPSDVVLMPAVGLPHSGACNALAERFLRTRCDALLLIDDDMVFRPSDIDAIRASTGDYAVFSGLYTTRREPIRPIALWWNGEAWAGKPTEELRGIIDCDVVGFGFTLISRGLIEQVAKLRGADMGIFTWTNRQGEDGEFCMLAAQLGHKVGINCGVRIGHRVTYTSRWNAEDQAVEMEIESFGMHERKG